MEWSQKLDRAERLIQAEAGNLLMISNALEAVGNEKLAMRLFEIVRGLQEAAADIRQGNYDAVSDRVKAADEGTANMVKAALASASR